MAPILHRILIVSSFIIIAAQSVIAQGGPVDWTDKGKPHGFLILTTDTEAIVTLDAGKGFTLGAGDKAQIWFPKGSHTVEAVSSDGMSTWVKEVKLKKNEKLFLEIEFPVEEEEPVSEEIEDDFEKEDEDEEYVDEDNEESSDVNVVKEAPEEEEEEDEEEYVEKDEGPVFTPYVEDNDTIDWTGRDLDKRILMLIAKTDALVTMDGAFETKLPAGEKVVFLYPKGKHLVEVREEETGQQWSRIIKLFPLERKTLEISFQEEDPEGPEIYTDPRDIPVYNWTKKGKENRMLQIESDSDVDVKFEDGQEITIKAGGAAQVWFPRGKKTVIATSHTTGKVLETDVRIVKNDKAYLWIDFDEVEADPDDEDYVPLGDVEGMVRVEGGKFLMGDRDGEEDEQPVHEVYVSTFYMDEDEVTNQEFCDFLNEYGIREEREPWIDLESKYCRIEKKKKKFRVMSGFEQHPVVKVTWYGAEAFARSKGLRLPTEAEWEYAAKAGVYNKTFEYAGGNNPDPYAWYFNNSLGNIMPVRTREPNEIGLYDMTGNVWEWCSDWYDKNYYSKSPERNPTGPEEGTYRVLRGGSSKSTLVDGDLSVHSRNYSKPSYSNFTHGFRCARDAEKGVK